MEAKQFKTVEDLLACGEERVELIDGEIVKRPMARGEHAMVQSGLSDEVSPLKRKTGPGGWWIMAEIGVRYNEHQCPCHDLAGWRKERLPHRPAGIMTLPPDWVCEITSPGHERKDVFHTFLLLQRSQVPYYWISSPEDRTLIAYEWVDGKYHVVFSVECKSQEDFIQARIPPFMDAGIDLAYVFGNDEPTR